MPKSSESPDFGAIGQAWKPKKGDTGSPPPEQGRPLTPQEIVILNAIQGASQQGRAVGFQEGFAAAKRHQSISESLLGPVRQGLAEAAGQIGQNLGDALKDWSQGGLENNPGFQALQGQPRQPSAFEVKAKQAVASTAKRVGTVILDWVKTKIRNQEVDTPEESAPPSLRRR